MRIADGRPLYWAAPRTTIASAGRRSSWLPTSPDPPGRPADDRDRADDADADDAEERPLHARMRGGVGRERDRIREPATAVGQRPWHFLYFWPDPHQHGSLRPIRAPDGVNPGFASPVRRAAAVAAVEPGGRHRIRGDAA